MSTFSIWISCTWTGRFIASTDATKPSRPGSEPVAFTVTVTAASEDGAAADPAGAPLPTGAAPGRLVPTGCWFVGAAVDCCFCAVEPWAAGGVGFSPVRVTPFAEAAAVNAAIRS